ncbi:MAG: MFS transporter, partial [Defluviitaleaceae bacterium]|nr:MFS transporter [Defluviitaleaceae bacterium]
MKNQESFEKPSEITPNNDNYTVTKKAVELEDEAEREIIAAEAVSSEASDIEPIPAIEEEIPPIQPGGADPAPARGGPAPSADGPAPDPRRWTILRIVVLMTLMSTLDSSIVNIALPNLSATMNEPISIITWVVTSYLIVICALALFFGRLGDIKGNTRIFKFGIIVFTSGSLLCGLSVNLTMLVISRVIQAVGAAAAMSTSQGIITHAFPAHDRGRALGFNGTSVAIGSLIGPPLGGIIVSALNWHFIFLINVPIGIVAFILAMRVLPKGKTVRESLDMKGIILFGLGAVAIFCAIGSGEDVDFLNPWVISVIALGVVLLVLFIIVERWQKQPMLDLSIFRNALFSVSVICAFLVFVSLSSINILQPFYLQNARSLSSLAAGLMMMIYPVVLAVAAP